MGLPLCGAEQVEIRHYPTAQILGLLLYIWSKYVSSILHYTAYFIYAKLATSTVPFENVVVMLILLKETAFLPTYVSPLYV